MRYMLLIYSDESHYTKISEAEMGALMGRYAAFSEKYADRASEGERLQPVQTATTVRIRNGERVATDGPFAETKEQLGGYYIIEAADLDEAIRIAAEIPTSEYGSVEVRPVWEMEG